MSIETRETHIALAKKFLEYIGDREITPKLLESYIEDPDRKNILDNFRKKDWGYRYGCLKEAAQKLDKKIEFKGLEEVSLKNLTKKHMGKFIQLEQCNISSIAPNRPIIERTTFVCKGCDREASRPPRRGEDECCEVNDYVESPKPEDIVDAQWLRVQETQRSMSQSKIPIALPMIVKGEDMLWQFGFNERIIPKGVLRYRITKNKMGDKEMNPFFEVLDYEKTSGVDEEISLNDVDRKIIRDEQKKPGFWQKLIASFCPWIVGQEVMKEVVLLGIGSMKTDMPLRILIVGDPSTGKSDVLKAANMLPAQKHYAVMKYSRGTGLTVTSVRDPDTDQWTVEGGEFVWADEWALIIDEFQAGREEDIDGLNSVIWDHEIPYKLAGGVRGKFKTKCAIIFACNPSGGVVAKETNIHELLKFVGEKTLPAFITRMTFILYLEDTRNQTHEEKVAASIYDNMSDEVKLARFSEDWYAENKVIEQSTTVMRVLEMEPIEVEVPDVTSEKRFGIKSLQKILKYVTEEVILEPMPKGDMRQQFIDYYVGKRMDVTERVNKIVSPRYMSHLLGIAQNRGRWHGRSQPNKEDMEYAFDLMMKHMTLIATDNKTGEIDGRMIDGNMPESKMAENDIEDAKRKGQGHQIEWACKKAGAMHDDGYFTLSELQVFLHKLEDKNKWASEMKLMEWINNSVTSGSLRTGNGGMYKWTPTEAVLR